jgi:hypothetical protein
VAEPAILSQPVVGDDVARVNAELTDAFAAIREAVAAGRPVAVLLRDGDLLGQGDIADAALAGGLLGLVRAFALEGAKPGWRVNAVTHRGDEDAARAAAAALDGIADLSGQLIRLGTAHLGKLTP